MRLPSKIERSKMRNTLVYRQKAHAGKTYFSGNIYKPENRSDKYNNIFTVWPWLPLIVSAFCVPVICILGGNDFGLYESESSIIRISLMLMPLGVISSLFASFFLMTLPNRKWEAVLLLICCLVIFPIYFVFCCISIIPIIEGVTSPQLFF